MADDDKWKFAHSALTKKKNELTTTENAVNPPVLHDGRPRGIVENYKTNAIQRNVRIEMETEKAKGRLEVWKKHVSGQVLVENNRIDMTVALQLEEIGQQHLRNLQEIGISNYDDRVSALKDLSVRAAHQLHDI